MVRITIDDALKRQLLAANGVAQLCDSTGMPIARVTLIPNGYDDPESSPTQPDREQSASEGITTEELLIGLMKKRRRNWT